MKDLVYCDASHFLDTNQVIIGIVHGKDITRIKAHARTATIAELLAVLLARKLYPGKLIVNDCQTVVTVFQKGYTNSLQSWLGNEAQHKFLIDQVQMGGVMWQRRRSDDSACVVDTATRKSISPKFREHLNREGYKLEEFCF